MIDFSPLDNIVWNAIVSNPQWAKFGEKAGTFDSQISPLSGLKIWQEEAYQELYERIETDRVIVLFSEDRLTFPLNWELIHDNAMHQMVYLRNGPFELNPVIEIRPLKEDNIEEMLALTALTQPGPFLERTIDFGYYHGIFEGGKLAAMAGLRLQTGNFKEISAVCTHPHYTGKGYGKALLGFISNHIMSQNCIPFLHVKKGNPATDLYVKMGFEFRNDYHYSFLKKKEPGN